MNQRAESPAEAQAAMPWFSREGSFRFELGLRPGSDAFFAVTSENESILGQRAAILETEAEKHVVMMEEGAGLLRQARELAASQAGLEFHDGESPLDECIALGRAWEPDFLLLQPDSGGVPILVGGCVCFPSSWDVREKIGKPVDAIHVPVPALNQSLGAQIGTFLGRLRPGAVWQRYNWGVAATPEWNLHPALACPRLHEGVSLSSAWLRVEHQAFRGMNDAGGILFGIRISVMRLADLVKDAAAAQRLATLLETMPDDIASYKGLADCRLRLAEQLRAGERDDLHPADGGPA